ncbi:MAG: 2-(1,2-epoxy-1,2-dihydrophenyl)acetyl-CoA isomerase PaaG [Mycobacteriales bacterium]
MTERSYSTITVAVDAKVAHLTLNRPDKLNSLDPRMLEELLEALRGLHNTEDLNALVVTGSGRLFSAGVDLSTPFFMENVTDTSIFSGKRLLDWQHQLIAAIYELPFVTVAAVNGDAVGGGGLGIAMACDLRIAVRSARFWMVPSTLDVIQDFGLSWMMQRQIGPSRTLQMAMLGRPVVAEEGAGWGMVNELVDDQPALTARVAALTKQLNGLGTDALRMLKLVLRNGEHSQLREQLALEAIANGLTFQSREFGDKKAAYLGSFKGSGPKGGGKK